MPKVVKHKIEGEKIDIRPTHLASNGIGPTTREFDKQELSQIVTKDDFEFAETGLNSTTVFVTGRAKLSDFA